MPGGLKKASSAMPNRLKRAELFDARFRGVRGGNWNRDVSLLSASVRSFGEPAGESGAIGFRIASVPEPVAHGCGLCLLSVYFLRVLCKRRVLAP